MAGPVGGYAHGNMTNYPPFAAEDSMQSTPTDVRSFSLPSTDHPQQWHMFQQQQHHHHQQQQQARAMSYGNIEAMHAGYSQGHGYAGVPLQNMGGGGGGGSYGLPPLDVQSASMHQATGQQSAPVSVPMMPHFGRGMPFGYQAGTVPLQTGQPGWYAAPSNFDPARDTATTTVRYTSDGSCADASTLDCQWTLDEQDEMHTMPRDLSSAWERDRFITT